MVNDMERKHLFYRILNSAIRLFLAGAIFCLLLHSLFSTSFVGRIFLEDGSEQERTLNIADSPLRHLVFFALVTAALLAARWLWRTALSRGFRRRQAWSGDMVFRSLTIVTLAVGAAYVLMTQFAPASDPSKVFEIAIQWRQGDFSAFEEEGYLFCYPFQSGIVLFFYLLSFLFGIGNYVGIQLVNVICLAVIYGLLAKLAAFFWQGEGIKNAVHFSLLLWLPLAFYVTYLYGILPGMALSLGAVYFATRYLSARQYRYIAAASLCIGLATVIKMNCLIYLIAIACFLAYDAIDLLFLKKGKHGQKWVASLLFIGAMCLSVVFCGWANNRIVERIAGVAMPEGNAMIAWVVMGMQEAPLGPGGYNGYIGNVFTKYHYDTERITERSIEDLQKIMTRMSEYPVDEGIPFLARKTAFQWNDPTFICLDRTRGRKAAVQVPLWLRSLIDGRGSVTLSRLLNVMQTWILFCALLYVLLRWQSGNLYELIGAVVFLGGFLFHMFWESSASYTIPYFVLLIPYAVCGMAQWLAWLEELPKRIGEKEEAGMQMETDRKGTYVRLAAVLVCGLLLVAFMGTNLFHRTIALNDDLRGIDASDQFYRTGDYEAQY